MLSAYLVTYENQVKTVPIFVPDSNNNINIRNSNLNQDNTNTAEAGRLLKQHFAESQFNNSSVKLRGNHSTLQTGHESKALSRKSRQPFQHDFSADITREILVAASLFWEAEGSLWHIKSVLPRVGHIAELFGKQVSLSWVN